MTFPSDDAMTSRGAWWLPTDHSMARELAITMSCSRSAGGRGRLHRIHSPHVSTCACWCYAVGFKPSCSAASTASRLRRFELEERLMGELEPILTMLLLVVAYWASFQ